jgi:hypothetical protein
MASLAIAAFGALVHRAVWFGMVSHRTVTQVMVPAVVEQTSAPELNNP